MQEIFAQVLSHGLGVWRHKWVALGMAWIIALGGWAFVWKMPEAYVATARVYVDTNSLLRPLLKNLTISPDVNQRIAMLSQTLLSRPNLQKLARMTDLDLLATTESAQERLIQRLEETITLEGSRRNASLYTISVTDPDRETARRIVQALITVFIETSLSDKREDSSSTQSFLQRQIAESEKRLVEAESRLAAFKQSNVNVLPGGVVAQSGVQDLRQAANLSDTSIPGQNYTPVMTLSSSDFYSRLQQAQSELRQAQLQLREVENRRSELQRQINGEIPMADVRLPIDDRIQSLFVQIDSLLTRYTERHPEVVRLQALIAELEAQRDAELLGLRNQAGQGSVALASSPIYQGMRSMLASTEAEAAELRVRVAEYSSRVDDLAGKVNLIPAIEAQLKQLDRDYGVIAQQHQQLLARRESARLSEDVEASGDVTFRVVDPPFVPLKPTKPNKILLNVGVFLGAIGGGVGAALLLALTYPIVTDARMLAKITALPLLGSVSWNRTSAEKVADRWRLARFGACGTVLLLTFAGLLVVPVIIS